jgi:hypothetical protein
MRRSCDRGWLWGQKRHKLLGLMAAKGTTEQPQLVSPDFLLQVEAFAEIR